MRRTHGLGSETISVESLLIDLNYNYAKVGKTRLELTAEECQINEFLALQKGVGLNRDAVLHHFYGGINELQPKIIDVFICNLRRKLVENGAESQSVDIVWVQGYPLRDARLSRA